MGVQCGTLRRSTNKQLSYFCQVNHLVFGEIFVFKFEGEDKKCLKKVQVDLGQWKEWEQRLQIAKNHSSTIPTTVNVYDYEIINPKNPKSKHLQQLPTQKMITYFTKNKTPYFLIYFTYYPQNLSLHQILNQKQNQLLQHQAKINERYKSTISSIKMFDYELIDKLGSTQRHYVNVFYREIQILRMIDHVIGALYFFRHFQIECGGVRDQNVVVDGDGKYVLVDRQLFGRKTNIEVIRQYIGEQHENNQQLGSINDFMCPQYTQIHNTSKSSSEKADIFSVGSLALKMCLLDNKQKVFQFNKKSKTFNFNENQLFRRLVRVKERYSEELVQLVKKMMKKNPVERISFEQLIDEMTGLLQRNLDELKKVHYSPLQTNAHKSSKSSFQINKISSFDNNFASEPPTPHNQLSEDTKHRLIKIEKQYNKLMTSRYISSKKQINPQQMKIEEQNLLKRLSKIKDKSQLLEVPKVISSDCKKKQIQKRIIYHGRKEYSGDMENVFNRRQGVKNNHFPRN